MNNGQGNPNKQIVSQKTKPFKDDKSEVDEPQNSDFDKIEKRSGDATAKNQDETKQDTIQKQKSQDDNNAKELDKKNQASNITDIQVQLKDKDNSEKSSGKDGIDYIDLQTVFEQEKLNRFEKERYVNSKHPRKLAKGERVGIKNEKYQYSEILQMKGGWNFFGNTSKYSDFSKYGTGTTIYFKYMKMMAVMFTVFLLISLPIIFINSSAFYSSQTDRLSNINDFIISLSVGAIGLELNKCIKTSMGAVKEEYKTINGNLDNANYVGYGKNKISCNSGYIDLSKSLEFGFIKTNLSNTNNCAFLNYLDVETECNLERKSTDIQQTAIWKACHKNKSCTFDIINVKELFQTSSSCSSKFDSRNIYLNMKCEDTSVDIGLGNTIKSETAYNVIVYLDVAIIILFYLVIISLPISESLTQKKVDKNSYSIKHFTLQVSSLPPLPEKELVIKLHTFFQDFVQKKLQEQNLDAAKLQVIDIKLAETNKEITLTREMGQIQSFLLIQTEQFLDKYDKQVKNEDDVLLKKYQHFSNLSRVTITELRSFTEKTITNQKEQQKALKIIETMENLMKRAKEIDIKLGKTEEGFKNFKLAWITYETVEQKTQVYDLIYQTPIKRFCKMLFCCCTKKSDFQIDGHVLSIASQAEEPVNILWENIYVSKTNLFLRRSISWILTLALLIGAFFLTQQLNNYKDDLRDKYPSINCSQSRYSDFKYPGTLSQENKALIINEDKSDNNMGYIQCYCEQTVSNTLREKLDDKQLDKICQSWYNDYLQISTIPWAIAFILIVFNFVLRIVLQILSKYEKYEHLTAELQSKIIKVFVALFINTGLIILISNMDPLFSKNTGSTTVSRQFTGKYKDLDPEWFQNVGYVIVFTLFIQIFSSIAFAFGFQLLRFCSRLKDRGYTCKNNIDISKGPYNKQNLNTKKTKQSHWLYLYTGPELFLDFRYAYTLMIIFVTLFYGSGMPILYLAAALHFFVLYWLDKVFLFKVYQIPKNFDLSMSNLNINILYLAPVFHLAMAIYLFGNISIFYDPDEYDPKEEDFSHIKKWWIRLYRKQNYVVSIFFLVALGLFVLRIFFWTPFLKFLRICFPQKEKSKKDQEDYTKKYWDFLGEQNIKQELKLLSLYINSEQNEEKPLKELIQQYKYRYSELKKRIKTAGDSQLVGLFSYDVRHNPNYKSIFNWDNRVDVQKGGLEEILAGVGVEQLL